eukprot:2404456-Prymnesium_polylepis.1
MLTPLPQVIDFANRKFAYFDRGPPGEVLSNLQRWLKDEAHGDAAHGKPEVDLDLSVWEMVCYKDGTPRQRDGSNCGVIMLRTAQCLAQGARLDSIAQEDMAYWRQRTVYELLSGRLLHEEIPAQAARADHGARDGSGDGGSGGGSSGGGGSGGGGSGGGGSGG